MRLLRHQKTGRLYQGTLCPSDCVPVLGFQSPKRNIPHCVVGEAQKPFEFSPEHPGLSLTALYEEEEPVPAFPPRVPSYPVTVVTFSYWKTITASVKIASIDVYNEIFALRFNSLRGQNH
jgi:hypothetical protein